MDSFVRWLADDLLGRVGVGRRLVAIDGVDGSGKTSFATLLASHIEERRPAVLIHVDAFLNPAPVRHAKGRTSPEGYWLDSYDYPALIERVLGPLSPGGTGWYCPAVYDLDSERSITVEPTFAPPDAVIVVEGLFLHRDELAPVWDASAFLDVPFTVTAARMAVRDGSHPDPEHPTMRRYVGGQRLYFAAARPWERATYVVDNSDHAAPRRIQPEMATAARSPRPPGQP
ncbi:uridine kinase [Occultella gossypii]|uniref:Uridine kinase n=1 Tax=Occultella gossypii TaxID=2800820 RepID=A0ABS7SBB7_9MICO|nr:uridine kinase [Occultella gossypii]MBZ2196553.1 uridine kinase [Occultella gossypii]